MFSGSVIPHTTQSFHDPFQTGKSPVANSTSQAPGMCVSTPSLEVLNQSNVPQPKKGETITELDGLASGQL